MTLTTRGVSMLATIVISLAIAPSAQAQVAYALANSGTRLISFNLATPGTVTTIGDLSGATAVLSDIDFRASNGLLYGYNQITNRIVTVDPATGITTLASNPSPASSVVFTGVDFDPTSGSLRLVNSNSQNLRVNVANGSTTVDGTLAYAAGDLHANVTPIVVDVAYTNNDNNPLTGTSLYYIDTNLNTLVTTTAPNTGLLNTVGALGVAQGSQAGFDIFTNAGGVNSAYAILGGGNSPGLYNIDLGTGAASFRGNVNAPGNISGFAITPLAVTPEPGNLAMLTGSGFAGSFLVYRRRRNRK